MSSNNKTYRRKILITLTTYTVLFLVLFAVLLALLLINNNVNFKKRILKTYQDQLSTQIQTFDENINQYCLSLYFSPKSQVLLYSQNYSYSDLVAFIKEKKDELSSFRSYIHSIEYHNVNSCKTEVITHPSIQYTPDGFPEILYMQPKLTPIYRELYDVKSNSYEAVYSYVMYENYTSESLNPSFLIINVSIEKMLESFAQQTSSNFTYLALDTSNNSFIGSNVTNFEISQDFLGSFMEDYPDFERETKTIVYKGLKYLLVRESYDISDTEVLLFLPYVPHGSISYSIIAIFGIIFILSSLFSIYRTCTYLYQPTLDLAKHINSRLKSPAIDLTQDEYDAFTAFYDKLIDSINFKKLTPSLDTPDQKIANLLSSEDETEISSFIKEFPLHWLSQQNYIYLCCTSIHLQNPTDRIYDSKERSLWLFAAKNIFEELIADNCFTHTVSGNSSNLLFILGIQSRAFSLPHFFNNLSERMQDLFDISITICCSSCVNTPFLLHNTYTELLEIEKYKFLWKDKHVLCAEMFEVNYNNPAVTYPKEICDKLLDCIKKKDILLIQNTIHDLEGYTKQLNYKHMNSAVYALLLDVDRQCKSFGLFVSFNIPELAALFFADVAVFFDKLTDLLVGAISVKDDHLSKNERFVLKVNSLIEDNISSKDLSSQWIANNLDITVKYLLKKYKDLTDTSLPKLITQVRLERAREFLTSGKYSVAEVVDLVGIENKNYFFKQFREHFGCTPMQYIHNSNERHQPNISNRKEDISTST